MPHLDLIDYGLSDELVIQADGPIRLVTLNRPENLNGANRPMHQSLARLWEKLGHDDDARAVVLTGSGRAFSAGGDFAYMQENIDDEAMRVQTMQEGRAIIEGMIRCRLPVIAAVNGPAVGLGCSLALMSDIVLIAEGAFLADPHLRMGLVPGDGAMTLPALTGLSRAKEYLFLGTRITAEDAVRLGLASRTVAPQALLDEAFELARKLAKVPAVALQDTKRALNSYLEVQLEKAYQIALSSELTSLNSIEHHQAVASAQIKAATNTR